MDNLVIKMTNINKSFFDNHVLHDVDFSLCQGEIHALMGENGAGKSTLMKILCGVLKSDTGEIEAFGNKVTINNVNDAKKIGIRMVFQELNLMKDLSVAQNIFIGREFKKGPFIDDAKINELSKQVFEKMHINIDPSALVKDLTIGQQQMVEIAKAISDDVKVLILDEPTAALSEKEVDELFKILKVLKENKVTMIYISHRMDEIFQITDRITVLRDGHRIQTLNTKDTNRDEIIKLMIGRTLRFEVKKHSEVDPNAPVVLEAKNITRGKMVRDISFKLRKGEILGFAGLMGAGRTETMRCIYGADRKQKGKVFVNGQRVKIHSPNTAINVGICYLSEDRKQYGLMNERPILDNESLSSIHKFSKFSLVNDTKMNSEIEKINEKLQVKYSSIYASIKNLSGGNQQKTIIARWFLKDPDIFIFDEPTRGVDVGAKSEIYNLLKEMVKNGKSIIVVSSELAEIQQLCDRVIVMCEGRITAELDISEVTQETVMKYATMREERVINNE